MKQTVQITQPLNRRLGAPSESPYSISNSRITKSGTIIGLREPDSLLYEENTEYDVIIGDDATTTFNGNTSLTPVKKGSVVFTGPSGIRITDDFSGTLRVDSTSPIGATGTIDYVTGAWSVTIENRYDITFAETGSGGIPGFTVLGRTQYLESTFDFQVENSTGNDGTYTAGTPIFSYKLSGIWYTDILVAPDPLSSVGDGDVVVALRNNTSLDLQYAYQESGSLSGRKPWVKWNDHYLGRSDGIEDWATHNGYLYTVQRQDEDKAPQIKIYTSKHTTSSTDTITEPAIITSITNSDQFSADGKGVLLNHLVQYCFIPINKREEAGPRAYHCFHNMTGGAFDNRIPIITVEANDETSYIEVYRTREKDVYGGQDDTNFYFVKRLTVSEVAGTNTANFYDELHWDKNYNTDPEQEVVENVPTVELETLRKHNTHTVSYTHSVGNTTLSIATVYDNATYRKTGSNTIYKHNNVMLYGGVEWPKKYPVISGRWYTANIDVTVQYEYRTNNGVEYGPTITINDCGKLDVEWQGESALLIYANNGGGLGFVERLVPDVDGRYRTTYTYDKATSENIRPRWAFDYSCITSGDATIDTLVSTETENETHIYEKNTVLISEINRPFEITFEQYFLEDGGEVQKIVAARQSELESQNYQFYTLTTKGVYVCDRDGFSVVSSPVVADVGVRVHQVELSGATDYFVPIVSPTKTGVVFQGTDNRLYYIEGRRFRMLDDDVPNIWYRERGSEIATERLVTAGSGEGLETIGGDPVLQANFPALTMFDLSYDIRSDEIYVATQNNIWIYSFIQNGWVANYKEDNILHLQYFPEVECVIGYVDNVGTDEHKIYNETGSLIKDTYFVTQPILRGSQRVHTKSFSIDYKPFIKKNNVTITDASSLIELEDPDQDQVEWSDIGSIVWIGDVTGTTIARTLLVETGNPPRIAEVLTETGSGHLLNWVPRCVVTIDASSESYREMFDKSKYAHIQFQVYPNKKLFPKMIGNGFLVQVSRFEEFKSFDIEYAEA